MYTPLGLRAPAPAVACVCRRVADGVDLLDLQRLRPERYPHLLESVAHGTAQARYDLLFAFPEYTVTLSADGRLQRDGRALSRGSFLQALDEDWHALYRPGRADDPPFSGGWFAYLGYELVAEIEPKLGTIPKPADLPVAALTRIPAAVIRDHARQTTELVCEGECADALLPQLEADLAAARDLGACSDSIEVRARAEDDPERFLAGVKRILAYIRAGDVFQVNLSRAWDIRLSRPMNAAYLYDVLRRANPAPFAGLATLDASRALLSSSPERLVAVRGERVLTRPIAGTYPRSPDRAQDERWSRELLRHPKERAEHVMLIDLERNDLGRVCRAGSVKVDELMVLESYRHVHHIVSQVSGQLRAGVTPADVIRAVFPGGTITGCPKVRCMEIISELEAEARGPYTGSMGYINRDGSMDLNILIRTMLLDADRVRLRAGAGIVADSRPLRELQETRAKARGLLCALGGEDGGGYRTGERRGA